MSVSTQLRKPKHYSDFKTSFITHPIKKDLVIIENEDSVIESIKNILLTGPYERFWQPNLGSGLKKYLFEQPSKITESAIRESIRNTILNYEKRCELIEVLVNLSNDEQSYVATITFSVINKEENITFSVLLNRLR